MKRYLFSAAFLLAAVALHAQQDLNTAADALHYSQDNLTGTARFRAMSGAFGAVGGDVSAMMINPAGSAVFNYNTGTASLSSYNISNKSNYFGTTTKRNDNALDLNQIGAVFVFNNTNEEAFMKKFTLGFNYENNSNADNTIYTRGVNPTNSIDQYFLRYANGIGNEGGIKLGTLNNADYGDLSFIDQQAYLGYNAYIINPVDDNPNNTSYVSNVPNSGNYSQENFYTSTGYNGKIALNFAAQLKDRLYVGANLNVHFVDYRQNNSFYENTNNAAETGLQSIRFDNQRYTYGGGFSFNLGAIYKVTEEFRAGLAYESPTWMKLQDEITQSISSYCPECEANSNNNTFITDPGVTFVFDSYTIKTPSKLTGSLAYIFGKNGLISLDYAIKDYSKTKFTNDRYSAINNQLSNTLDVAGELRVGAEYRIKKFSLRGGYRFEQSPYKNGNIGDLTGYSGGLGYSFGGSRIDLAYSWYQRKAATQLLTAGFTDAARVTSTNNNVTLSYTLDL
jgi:hypothetical protein